MPATPPDWAKLDNGRRPLWVNRHTGEVQVQERPTHPADDDAFDAALCREIGEVSEWRKSQDGFAAEPVGQSKLWDDDAGQVRRFDTVAEAARAIFGATNGSPRFDL